MNIKDNSKKVEPGDIFVAMKGTHYDGHDFIVEAINKGARKVIVEKGLYQVDTLVVNDTHDYLARYLKEHEYEELKTMKLIGVTGTNGKTTTCFLIQEILNRLGHKCAYIGTIGLYIEKKIRDLNNTTPDILELYEILKECKKEGCEYVVMEVSSQALSMNRVSYLEYDYAIFTNLTRDHLDYHKDMKNYALAKQKLFQMIKESGIAFVNGDDAYQDYFVLPNHTTLIYGFSRGDYEITDYKITKEGSTFLLKNELETKEYHTNLIGKYNLYNLLSVIALLKEIGICEEEIQKEIKTLKGPDGRMEIITSGDNKIIIDYAHTPDALENIIACVRPLTTSRVITMIGCGGNRDKEKRPMMASLATSLSDYAIFTSDNPRDEDPEKILHDMVDGLYRENYEIIINRKDAITRGVQMLEKDDILLVLGKGHEKYQIIGNEKIEFDDVKVVLDII